VTLPEKIAVARLRLATYRPYLSIALWSLVPVERPGLTEQAGGPMAVDRYWRLYYDPQFVENTDVAEIAGILYHEICHLLRMHPERLGDRNPTLANLAADMEINDNLRDELTKDDGLKKNGKRMIVLPEEALLPGHFGLPEGLLAEEYYEALARNVRQTATGGGGGGGGTRKPDRRTDSGGGSEGTSGPAPQTDTGDRSGGGSGGTRKPDPERRGPGRGGCGSCSNGTPEPWEAPPPSSPGAPPGLSPVESELRRRQVAEEIVRILESGRDRGTVPGHWKRWAERALSPHVDWRRELGSLVRRALVDASGAADYVFGRPSRRTEAYRPFVLPALRQPVPRVAVVIDTSASIADAQLERAVAEVAGILRAAGYRQDVRVFAVDACVQAAGRVFNPKQVVSLLRGGGGTDMGVGIRAAAEDRPRPDVAVVITDGHTPWPDAPPDGMRVVVCLVGDGTVPGWAKTVRVEIRE